MISYAWSCDRQYFSTAIDRWYRQKSFLIQPTSQALAYLLGMSTLIWYALPSDDGVRDRLSWIMINAAIAFFLPKLIRYSLLTKYVLRPTFGAKMTFEMGEDKVRVTGAGAGQFQWITYRKAVSFTDGILLIANGGIRWLPHSALREGSVEQALALIQSKLPIHDLT